MNSRRSNNETVEGEEVIVIQQANPQVVYVPSYNPAYVYGPMGYPYPSIWYPPYYGRSDWGGCDYVWRWAGDRRRLGRRLGLGLRLGRRQHQHQQN